MVDAIQKAEQRSPGNMLADAEEEDQTRVYVCDINPNMLEVGKQRAKERGDDFTTPNFRVAKPCPFVYCLSGIDATSSHAYVQSSRQLHHKVKHVFLC